MLYSSSPGFIYPVLNRLAHRKLITGRRILQQTKPSKIAYSLTRMGEGVFTNWIHDFSIYSDNRNSIRSFHSIALFFHELTPSEKRGHVEGYKKYLLRMRAAVQETTGRSSDMPINAVQRQHAVFSLDAELLFLERLQDTVYKL